MPTYRYRCADCGDYERWRSIHDDTPETHSCGRTAVKVLVVPLISADALPNKAHEARARVARDRREDADMWAYKRLRADGVQPRQIDGCSLVESRAQDRLEVEMGKGIPKENLSQAKDVQAELKENARTGVGLDVARQAPKVPA